MILGRFVFTTAWAKKNTIQRIKSGHGVTHLLHLWQKLKIGRSRSRLGKMWDFISKLTREKGLEEWLKRYSTCLSSVKSWVKTPVPPKNVPFCDKRTQNLFYQQMSSTQYNSISISLMCCIKCLHLITYSSYITSTFYSWLSASQIPPLPHLW
jgi:hypothetical protein